MTAERPKGRPEKLWLPTQEFFASHPRSKLVRDVCVFATDALDLLLHDPDVQESEKRKQQLYSSLESSEIILRDLGVKQNMHARMSTQRIQRNPVIAAEWIAGKLLNLTRIKIPQAVNVPRILEEFILQNTEHFEFMAPEKLYQPVGKLILAHYTLNELQFFLG